MIEKQFWINVKEAWIVSAQTKITNVHDDSEGTKDFSMPDDSEDMEVSFDDIDFDRSVESVISGGDFVMKDRQDHVAAKEQTVTPSRPALDTAAFEQKMGQRTLQGYAEAARLLLHCELPEEINGLYEELILRLPVLQDAVTKFEGVYQTDLDQFYDYYIPETLQLTSAYLEYLDAGIGEDIVNETEKEILDALKQLLIAVNDKVDEIYKFASIEIKAKAKALESLMSQDGYVDPKFKL